MRYQSKTSFAYMFRNFWQLVVITLPVSLLFAFFLTPNGEIFFMESLINGRLTMGNIVNFYTQAVTVLRFGKYWWAVVIGFVLLALTVSIVIVKIDRHMRVGDMPLLPLKTSFKFFPVSLLFVVCCVAAAEVLSLLSVGVMMLLRFVDNVIVVTAVSWITAIVVRLIETWLFMLLFLAFPLKFSDNYPLNVAFSYSARIMFKHKRLAWGAGFAYVFGRIAVITIGSLIAPYHLDTVLYFIAYLFIITYVPCLAYKLYYDDVGGERRDVSQVIFD